MRLKLLFLLLYIPLWGYAQSVSLELKDEPLPAALKKLEQSSGYRILFTYDDVQAYRVTASIHKLPVSEAIRKLIDSKPLAYTLKENRYIVITPRSASAVYSLKGEVRDSAGMPIGGATVILRKDGKVKTGSISNALGRYIVPNLGEGTYQLSISFLGYEPFHQTLSIAADTHLPAATLKDGSIDMEEVVIKSLPMPFKMKNGNIIARIAGSVLSRETNMLEMLRKIPGMTLSYGTLVSFTGSVPAIYINGRKALGMAEVNQLEIKNIRQVELITHPGAEYDSSIGTVMLITTINRQEGWSVQLDGNWRMNHYLANEEGIEANYHHGKLNLSGTFAYQDSPRQSHQIMKTTITTPDTLWHHVTDMRTKAREVIYRYSTGIDYDISKKQNIGMQYNGSTTATDYSSPIPMQVSANEKEYDRLLTRSDHHSPEYRHHLNAYYNHRWAEKLSLNAYADYLRVHNHATQSNDETSERDASNTVYTITNRADYHLYALSPKLTFTPADAHTLVLGAEWSRIDGKSFLSYDQAVSNKSDAENKEEKQAAYFSYSYRRGSFSVNTGLRYEHVRSDFYDRINASQHIRRNEYDLFPNIGISYNHNGLSQSLSYRSGTTRPRFDILNRNSYYMNRYCNQEGNPGLKPQYTYRVGYALTWKEYLYINLGYTYNKDFIGSYFYTPSETSPVQYYTWINYDKQQQVSALVNLHHRFGAYEPSLTFIYDRHIQKVPTMMGALHVDTPRRTINIDNNIHLPHNWLLNAEYGYTSRYSYNIFTSREKHIFNLGITKSFFGESLLLKLRGEDLLRKRMTLYDGRIGNIYFWQDESQDIRNVSLSLVYRFNNYSGKYKGKSVAHDEMRRL
ncbi:TonB-dependent receptor domain-containing protein [Phocaeicola sp.]